MQNYFQIFNLPISFNINLEELEKSYEILQQKNHPDINLTSSQEYSYKIEFLAKINMAFQTLKKPITRAFYLFQLETNINLQQENATIKPNIELLNQILELQEQLLFADNLQKTLLKQQIQQEINQIINQFALLSKNLQNLQQEDVLQMLIKLQYLDKIISHH